VTGFTGLPTVAFFFSAGGLAAAPSGLLSVGGGSCAGCASPPFPRSRQSKAVNSGRNFVMPREAIFIGLFSSRTSGQTAWPRSRRIIPNPVFVEHLAVFPALSDAMHAGDEHHRRHGQPVAVAPATIHTLGLDALHQAPLHVFQTLVHVITFSLSCRRTALPAALSVLDGDFIAVRASNAASARP